MPDEYKKRVVKEKEELDCKILILITFMDTNGFTLINPKEKERLEKQLLLMEDYSRVLGERISFF